MTNFSEETGQRPGTTSVKRKNARKSAFSQVVATLIECALMAIITMEGALVVLVIGALHGHPEEKLNMNNDQASWFGSLPSVTLFIGSFITGYLQDRFGRKGSMMLVSIPLCLSWLILYFADSIGALYVAAIIMGLCSGLLEAPLHSYIGEIAEDHVRGTLSTILSSSACVIGLVTFALGYFFHWRTTALVCAIVSVMNLGLITLLPESPVWLISKNRLTDAQKSLSWLRGWVKPEEVHDEFLDLVRYTKSSNKECEPEQSLVKSLETIQTSKEEQQPSQRSGYLRTKFKEITDKKLFRPLRMLMMIFPLTVTSCLMGMSPYLIGVLKKLDAPIDSKIILIIFTVLLLAGNVMNMVFLKRFGKRKIALLSQAIMTATVILLGVYSSFLPGSKQPWIPVILLANVRFIAGFGLLPLGWQLLTEVFPTEGRGNACGIVYAWMQVVRFCLTKSYLYLEEWIEFSGTMYLYGTVAAFTLLYFYLYLPETEGKSLRQIETYFTKEHNRKEKFAMGKKKAKQYG